MNILNLSTDKNIFNSGSAVARRFIAMGEALSGELHILVFSKKDEGNSPLQLSKNVFVHPTQSRRVLSYRRDALALARQLYEEGKLPRKNSLVTVQNPFEVGLIGVLIAKKLHLPLEVQIHTDFLNPYYRKVFWRHRFHLVLANKVLSHAQAVRVVSQKIKKQIEERQLTKAPIFVLPVFIEASVTVTPQNVDQKTHPIILVISRLAKEKNITAALHVFAAVIKKIPKAQCVIVGDGPERYKLEVLAQKLGLHEKVRFVGFQKDLGSFWQSATVLLHTAFFEGYGLVFVEAAARGVPIVSYDVGIAGELAADGAARVCPVGDESRLVEELENVLSDETLRQKLVEAGRREVEHLAMSKEVYFKKMINCWQMTLEKSQNEK